MFGLGECHRSAGGHVVCGMWKIGLESEPRPGRRKRPHPAPRHSRPYTGEDVVLSILGRVLAALDEMYARRRWHAIVQRGYAGCAGDWCLRGQVGERGQVAQVGY